MIKVSKEKILNLARKYSYRPFMYTEYPHKSFWSKKFNEQDFKTALKTLFSQESDTPLLLYVHIPFCRMRCWYCTCHTFIAQNYSKIKNYLVLLYREIELLHLFFNRIDVSPNFKEIHLGGGSPTLLAEDEFNELIENLKQLVDINKVSEFSLEVDPRNVDKEKMKYYHTKGINRISFGVQDFDFSVQKAVNRLQPSRLINELLTNDIRRHFPNGVNFDIICGLPLQSRTSIRNTFKKIVSMSPDRICFNYLHFAPRFAKHQKLMYDGRNGRPNRLPDIYEKKLLFLEGLNVLLDNGYVRLGYDHFAKPHDEVTCAMKTKKMLWNALGVTSGRYSNVIGVGVHSYSTIGSYYSQNFHSIPEYEARLRKGNFPIYRGYKLDNDGLIRRDVIQTLRNFFYLKFKDIEKKYKINFKEYFEDELLPLKEFVNDGILEISEDTIMVTELGQQFTDLVLSSFDTYIRNKK